ncbi:MAG: hypothetical protein R3E86_03885 [Pseudomonadales bacterium]
MEPEKIGQSHHVLTHHVLEALAHRRAADADDIASTTGLPVNAIIEALQSLQDQGCVESRWLGEGPRADTGRRYYRLTLAGIGRLEASRKQIGAGESPAGFFGTLTQGLHEAIDQVWGGIFQVSVRRQRERQAGSGDG